MRFLGVIEGMIVGTVAVGLTAGYGLSTGAGFIAAAALIGLVIYMPRLARSEEAADGG